MNWKGHLALGLGITIPLFLILIYKLNFIFTIPNSLALCLVFFISPLVMDLDHKHGKLREAVTYIGLIIGIIGVVSYFFKINLVILMVVGIIISSSAHLIFYYTKHRGITHSLLFCIIYALLVHIITTNIVVSLIAFVGCYSHLMGDRLYFKVV